jgi:catechol 2,3-dioxygenase-like lactoylglutathione lyase family enzyme
MKVLFIASFSPIASDPARSRAFYVDALGVPFDHAVGDYVYTEALGGAKHFGVWPLREAAQSCFGASEWPRELPIPQASLELEVDDVEAAARELEAKGHRLLHPPKTEPWGQTIARLLAPDGLLVGLCHTPHLRERPPTP